MQFFCLRVREGGLTHAFGDESTQKLVTVHIGTKYPDAERKALASVVRRILLLANSDIADI